MSTPSMYDPITVRFPEAFLIIFVYTVAGAIYGYYLGVGKADAVAERADALAVSAQATLAEARTVCGGAR